MSFKETVVPITRVRDKAKNKVFHGGRFFSYVGYDLNKPKQV